MTQYIKKSDIVVEIEKGLSRLENGIGDFEVMKRVEGVIKGYKSILSFLDTLEVKEVHDIWHDVSEKPELEQPLLIIMKGTQKDFRRHYRIGCYGKRANNIPTWVIAGCYSDSFISKWCYISDILQYTSEVKEVDTWHLQEKENIYDAVKDWSLQTFACVMKDGTIQKFTGNHW